MGMNEMSAADIAAVTRNGYDNDGFGFGNEGLWLFAILALMGGGFGNWGNNRNGCNPVTEADLCNANSFSELKNSVGRLSDQIDGVNINLTKAVCDLGYATLGNFNALERQLADCCCITQRAIDQVRFDGERNTAAINANTTAQVQKVLDAICGNRMADMQNQINQLQLQAALCGVVRYPNQTTYGAGFNPFFGGWGCGCNSGCCNNNI